ncbi:MAG TPA: flagellar hook-associated protein FlgL [Selenomonadales bacterium]|nr:flagellar hook-associated protein FlgL [Selenomonadales bacterium]
MRITNNMMIASTVRNINNAAIRLNEANERMSSQQKISLPSDDPVIATRAVKYRNYVATIAQYQKNVDNVSSWQKVTDDALSDLSDVIEQVRTLTVQASSDTLSDSNLAAIQTEISQLREQAIEIMNTTYGGRYVFGGFSTGEAPYELVSTDIGEVVTFKGQYLALGGVVSSEVDDSDISDFYTANAANVYQTAGAQSIKYNIGYDAEITVNIEGQDVIGEAAGDNLFDTFAKLLLALDGETSYKSYDAATGTATTVAIDDIDDLLTDLDNDLERLTTTQATLGARMKYVNSVSDRLDNDYTTYSTLMSENEDVDTALASTEAASAEYVYEASLAVGAKAISKTLVDYIA